MEVCQADVNEFAFEVDPPSRCHATTARLKAQARHESADEDTDSALLWGARLKG